jgi:PadR family transcriptional regulator, regulatory protein PadR
MILKTLDVLSPLHGYGFARRIEQINRDVLSVNQGTLNPVLLKLEQKAPLHPNGAPRRTTAGRSSIG